MINALVDHIERARDLSYRGSHITPRTVGRAVAEAALAWHTGILHKHMMVSREQVLSAGEVAVQRATSALRDNLMIQAADSDLVPVDLVAIERTWVGWRATYTPGPDLDHALTRYVEVSPAEADFLRIDGRLKVRPSWSTSEVPPKPIDWTLT